MSMHTSLFRQIERQESLNTRIELRCQLARELEEEGNCQGAKEALSEIWNGLGAWPELAGLSNSLAAEVLLIAGRLTSQSSESQDEAREMLQEALTRFDSISYGRKSIEARKELAISYWRSGAFDRARLLLREAIDLLGPVDGELKARVVQCAGMVEHFAKRHHEALNLLLSHAPLFEKIRNHFIKGNYHNDLANVYSVLAQIEKRAEYLDNAILEYTAAAYHYEQCGHKQSFAIAKNNLGLAYLDAHKYEEAHNHLLHARRILTAAKAKFLIAQVEDSRARVLLAQRRYNEAEQVARSAVCVQEKGDRADQLAEALITHATALARLSYYAQAHANFSRAIEVALSQNARECAAVAALTMLEELHDHLSDTELRDIYSRADDLLSQAEPHLIERLRRFARRIVTSEPVKTHQTPPILPGVTLQEALEQHEKRCIAQALKDSQGSVTRAARLLGLSHQSLTYMLRTRHKELLAARTPVRRRRKPGDQ